MMVRFRFWISCGLFIVAILFYSSSGYARCANLFHETSTLPLESLVEIMLGEAHSLMEAYGLSEAVYVNPRARLLNVLPLTVDQARRLPRETEILRSDSTAFKTGEPSLKIEGGFWYIEAGELYRLIAEIPEAPSPPKNRWIDSSTNEIRIPGEARIKIPRIADGTEIREWPIELILLVLVERGLRWEDPDKPSFSNNKDPPRLTGFLVGLEPEIETARDRPSQFFANPVVIACLRTPEIFEEARRILLSQYPELARFENALPERITTEELGSEVAAEKIDLWLRAMQHILGGMDSLPLVMPKIYEGEEFLN